MKFKLTFTVEVEYEVNPNLYQGGAMSAGDMLATDLAAADEDPFLFLGDTAEWAVKGEIVEADK